jgi:hypothetical protein
MIDGKKISPQRRRERREECSQWDSHFWLSARREKATGDSPQRAAEGTKDPGKKEPMTEPQLVPDA